jgi:hypothetical protein
MREGAAKSARFAIDELGDDRGTLFAARVRPFRRAGDEIRRQQFQAAAIGMQRAHCFWGRGKNAVSPALEVAQVGARLESSCGEFEPQVRIGGEEYYLTSDGLMMRLCEMVRSL